MSSPSRERRKFPRVRLLARPGRDSRIPEAPLVVRDISSGGFCLESSLKFTVGERHVFVFSQPGESPAVLTGVVRHSLRINWPDQGAAHLTGFEFLDIPPQTRALVDRLLDHAVESRSDALDVAIEVEEADTASRGSVHEP